jgi:hypothetical protein
LSRRPKVDAEPPQRQTPGDVPSPAGRLGKTHRRTSRQWHPATSVVALFGPTDARVWAPRGEHVHLVESPDGTMEGIDVEAAWEAVRAALE